MVCWNLKSHWVAFPEPPTWEGHVPELGANSLQPGLPGELPGLPLSPLAAPEEGSFQAKHLIFPPSCRTLGSNGHFKYQLQTILAQTFSVFGNISLSET